MNKLLAANFAYILKNRIFWICTIFMAAAGFFFPVMQYMNTRQTEFSPALEDGFFVSAILILIIAAIFCSLFIGTEYSDGTIRNKIIVGRTRTSIYLANLTACTAASLFQCLAFFLSYLLIGVPLLGFFEADIRTILLFVLCCLFIGIAVSGFFTLISMLVPSRAFAAVVCILSSYIFLMIGAYCTSRLQEPETYPAYTYTAEGETTSEEEVPNPNYLSGTKRQVYTFINDFLPGGQAIQCSSMDAENPPLLILYSALILAVSTGSGLFFFRRKDLK